jgi:hypothetical protein
MSKNHINDLALKYAKYQVRSHNLSGGDPNKQNIYSKKLYKYASELTSNGIDTNRLQRVIMSGGGIEAITQNISDMMKLVASNSREMAARNARQIGQVQQVDRIVRDVRGREAALVRELQTAQRTIDDNDVLVRDANDIKIERDALLIKMNAIQQRLDNAEKRATEFEQKAILAENDRDIQIQRAKQEFDTELSNAFKSSISQDEYDRRVHDAKEKCDSRIATIQNEKDVAIEQAILADQRVGQITYELSNVRDQLRENEAQLNNVTSATSQLKEQLQDAITNTKAADSKLAPILMEIIKPGSNAFATKMQSVVRGGLSRIRVKKIIKDKQKETIALLIQTQLRRRAAVTRVKILRESKSSEDASKLPNVVDEVKKLDEIITRVSLVSDKLQQLDDSVNDLPDGATVSAAVQQQVENIVSNVDDVITEVAVAVAVDSANIGKPQSDTASHGTKPGSHDSTDDDGAGGTGGPAQAPVEAPPLAQAQPNPSSSPAQSQPKPRSSPAQAQPGSRSNTRRRGKSGR